MAAKCRRSAKATAHTLTVTQHLMKLIKIIYILSFGVFLGCVNNRNIEGYYSNCRDGEYMEVYFKKDSMRVAADNEWVRLSEWRKIVIENDTLHFETFGEYRESWQAVIEYVGTDKIKLKVLESKNKVNLNRIDEILNFEEPTSFWNDFHKRKDYANCKSK